MILVSKIIKNHKKSSKILKKSMWIRQLLKLLKTFKRSQNFRLCRLPTKISPSSEGVRSKIRYLRLPTQSQLSRKQVFRTIGDVLRAEKSIPQKSTEVRKIRMSSLGRLFSTDTRSSNPNPISCLIQGAAWAAAGERVWVRRGGAWGQGRRA